MSYFLAKTVFCLCTVVIKKYYTPQHVFNLNKLKFKSLLLMCNTFWPELYFLENFPLEKVFARKYASDETAELSCYLCVYKPNCS